MIDRNEDVTESGYNDDAFIEALAKATKKVEAKYIKLSPLVGPEHDSRHEVRHSLGKVFAYGYSGLKQVYWCEWLDIPHEDAFKGTVNRHDLEHLTYTVRKGSFKQGAALIVLDEIHEHDILIPEDHMTKLFMDLPV